MPDPQQPTWYDALTAHSALAISVTDKGLAAAREQCLRVKGLPLDLAAPPSESFAQGVVYQALANRNATAVGQAGTDEWGIGDNTVQLRPLDGKIMALLIIPRPDATDSPTADRGRVGSMIG
ncbi:hypothetical protein [Microbacterium rhizophilus]|uniref:hypothetical protein n=1 Tax=Microbacterium rhizophilus TaxID=3138934 RepID=UPI0031EA40BB